MTSTAPRSEARSTESRRPAALVILFCWLLVVFDGYDLIVYGTTLPQILKEPGWNLTAASGGFIGSLAFLGMLIGALAAGDLADRLGRRRTILWTTIWFSVMTLLCAWAPNREVFGILRFLGGVGLGGLVPSANALTAEFVHARRRSMVSTVMMSGVPIGGSLAAVLGLGLIPNFGWRSMYVCAGLGLVVAALCWFRLPESPTWLLHKGRTEEARRTARLYGVDHTLESAPTTQSDAWGRMESPHPTGMRALFSREFVLPTILFALATVATLFAWYGLGTWLPKLMSSDARFDMGNPLGFLLALNLGAVIGSFVTAWAGSRFGPLRSAVIAAALAAGALAFLLTYPHSVTPVYAALILAGVGTHGTQCLIIAAVASHYPAQLRGSGLGFALGIGRIGAVLAPQVGGWLLEAQLGVGSNFTAFALAAGLAAVLLLVTTFVTRRTTGGDVLPANHPAAV